MYFNIYLNQIKLCLNKSFNCVKYNDLIFIKMDLILAKLFIFVINYLFSKKNYIFVNYDSNKVKLHQNKG